MITMLAHIAISGLFTLPVTLFVLAIRETLKNSR